MNELEACALAADYLKRAGFEHRYTSMKSEAAYYGLPGKHPVIRVAGHRYAGPEFGMAPVNTCLTFTPTMTFGSYGEPKIAEMVARAIGYYILRTAGIVPLTAKERARRAHKRIKEAERQIAIP